VIPTNQLKGVFFSGHPVYPYVQYTSRHVEYVCHRHL